jgi:hypothetical protein
MTVERGLRFMAGLFVIATVVLAYFHSKWWLLFTGFVGLNLLQSAFTDWCPAMWMFEKLGMQRCERPRKTTSAENQGETQ